MDRPGALTTALLLNLEALLFWAKQNTGPANFLGIFIGVARLLPSETKHPYVWYHSIASALGSPN